MERIQFERAKLLQHRKLLQDAIDREGTFLAIFNGSTDDDIFQENKLNIHLRMVNGNLGMDAVRHQIQQDLVEGSGLNIRISNEMTTMSGGNRQGYHVFVDNKDMGMILFPNS